METVMRRTNCGRDLVSRSQPVTENSLQNDRTGESSFFQTLMVWRTGFIPKPVERWIAEKRIE
jgi:hypothetical protein